jgi:ribosomal protein S3AE
MAKIQKKKFFEVEIPIVNEKVEIQANSLEELNNKTVKLDLTRQLRGKSVEVVFLLKIKDGKVNVFPKNLTLLSYFIKHMLHTGIDYVEDSFTAESSESRIVIKPFLITRKKVSRAVRNALRNSARNWLIDYIKTKDNTELFQEILSNQLQKSLSLKLKKIYPLAICEIRVFEVKSK